MKSSQSRSLTSDVKGEKVLLLRGRADGEGVPFGLGDGRYFDKHPIARGKVEVVGPPDDQVGHFGGQDHPGEDAGLALAHERRQDAVGELQHEDDPWGQDPLPKLGGMEHQQCPERNV